MGVPPISGNPHMNELFSLLRTVYLGCPIVGHKQMRTVVSSPGSFGASEILQYPVSKQASSAMTEMIVHCLLSYLKAHVG